MTETTHEHKAPAKKRVMRKKVVHHKTHAELEIDAYTRKLDAIFNGTRTSFPFGFASFNEHQVKALYKKIAKRERTVVQQAAKA